ncbi:MAG: uracil-DNA glycosylase [Pseudomonadota bacterium]
MPVNPGVDCPLCPRLVEYRHNLRADEPSWYNAPVPTFGDLRTAELLIVGLAPGVRGANRTGRAFTGDFAGDVLYPTLLAHGLATGEFDARPDDTLQLKGCAITNAVRCVPPQNKPTGPEINACRTYLADTIEAMPRLRIMLALGRIAHDAALRTMGEKLNAHTFKHGTIHALSSGLRLADSYHTSRYNVNTRVLTPDMFDAVIATLAAILRTRR